MSLGYSLALFGIYDANRLRQWAEDADNKGNGNGLLDNDEINVFKENIKKRCGYDFDFSNIKQAQLKNIEVDGYSTTTEIAQKYKSSTVKIINNLNPTEAKYDKNPNGPVYINNYTREHGINIAYMSEKDFQKSKKAVSEQEVKYFDACENLKNAQDKLYDAGLNEYYKVELDGNTVVIRIKENQTRTRAQVIENFGFSECNVKKDKYVAGDILKSPLDEFSPQKEKSFLQKLFQKIFN